MFEFWFDCLLVLGFTMFRLDCWLMVGLCLLFFVGVVYIGWVLVCLSLRMLGLLVGDALGLIFGIGFRWVCL